MSLSYNPKGHKNIMHEPGVAIFLQDLVCENLVDVLGVRILNDELIQGDQGIEFTSGLANITVPIDMFGGKQDNNDVEALWIFRAYTSGSTGHVRVTSYCGVAMDFATAVNT